MAGEAVCSSSGHAQAVAVEQWTRDPYCLSSGWQQAGGFAGLSRSREAIDERLLLRIGEHSGLREEREEELPMEVLKILQRNETKRFAQSDSTRCVLQQPGRQRGRQRGR